MHPPMVVVALDYRIISEYFVHHVDVHSSVDLDPAQPRVRNANSGMLSVYARLGPRVRCHDFKCLDPTKP